MHHTQKGVLHQCGAHLQDSANLAKGLEFPEFLVNTVVPERHSRKGWGTPEGEQEGESPSFRAGKGQEFLTCESREGHRESIGAKGQWFSLVKDISHCKANTLRRSLAENSANLGKGFLTLWASLDNNSKVMKEPPLWLLTNQIRQFQCR
jgi:hypothetical protein